MKKVEKKNYLTQMGDLAVVLLMCQVNLLSDFGCMPSQLAVVPQLNQELILKWVLLTDDAEEAL